MALGTVLMLPSACNGTIVNDSEMGEVIQLQGDQRKDVQEFLVDKKEGLELDAKTIKVSFRHVCDDLIWFPANSAIPGPWFLVASSTALSLCPADFGTNEEDPNRSPISVFFVNLLIAKSRARLGWHALLCMRQTRIFCKAITAMTGTST